MAAKKKLSLKAKLQEQGKNGVKQTIQPLHESLRNTSRAKSVSDQILPADTGLEDSWIVKNVVVKYEDVQPLPSYPNIITQQTQTSQACDPTKDQLSFEVEGVKFNWRPLPKACPQCQIRSIKKQNQPLIEKNRKHQFDNYEENVLQQTEIGLQADKVAGPYAKATEHSGHKHTRDGDTGSLEDNVHNYKANISTEPMENIPIQCCNSEEGCNSSQNMKIPDMQICNDVQKIGMKSRIFNEAEKEKKRQKLENFPLCGVLFSKGMGQIDIDGHIASCLAVTDDDAIW